MNAAAASALAILAAGWAYAAPAAPLRTGTTGQGPADDVVPFNPADYPRRAFSRMLAENSCDGKGGASELKDALFSVELVYQGAVRKSTIRRNALIGSWAKAIGDPGAEAKYKEEITLAERGDIRWLAAPEGLLAYMQMDLQPGDRVLVYLVFIGCVARQPLFAIDEFEPVEQRDDEAEDFLIRLQPSISPLGGERIEPAGREE